MRSVTSVWEYFVRPIDDLCPVVYRPWSAESPSWPSMSFSWRSVTTLLAVIRCVQLNFCVYHVCAHPPDRSALGCATSLFTRRIDRHSVSIRPSLVTSPGFGHWSSWRMSVDDRPDFRSSTQPVFIADHALYIYRDIAVYYYYLICMYIYSYTN